MQPSLCPHLQPIEDAMIAAGIVVHQHEAQCRFDARGISTELHYYFGYSPERHPLDNPYGAIA